MNIPVVDAPLYCRMLAGGAENLQRHAAEINELNVFPIPDGDTGDNMLLTIRGGLAAQPQGGLGTAARAAGDGMLVSARGNSGVILSQLFDGIAAGLSGLETADAGQLSRAFEEGVAHAYRAVLEPTEGTILTVAREATQAACAAEAADIAGFFAAFLAQAERSLQHTPELLPVLKKAGVVDSGGAGLLRIVEGMQRVLTGEPLPAASVPADAPAGSQPGSQPGLQPGLQPNIQAFTEDSVLEYGYCTELLLRLQTAKTDVEAFAVETLTEYLQTIGNSVVAFKTGSIVKVHVHTMMPDRVLAFCQRYGEFLTVKIENMSLQHNNLSPAETPAPERRPFGVVTVACGEGIQALFRQLGADEVINGGQSMNPSAGDFLAAFDRANADTIFVLPNNGNVLLAARQAAGMYTGADVRVIESRSLGEGYAALSMLNTESGDADAITAELTAAMEGVVTAAVATCSRDTDSDGLSLYKGEYIGFIGDRILSADNDPMDTARRLVDELDFTDREICILLSGKDADEQQTQAIRSYIAQTHPGCELYVTAGGQEIYRYILIIE